MGKLQGSAYGRWLIEAATDVVYCALVDPDPANHDQSVTWQVAGDVPDRLMDLPKTGSVSDDAYGRVGGSPPFLPFIVVATWTPSTTPRPADTTQRGLGVLDARERQTSLEVQQVRLSHHPHRWNGHLHEARRRGQ